ncbi:MAG: hypothetical protein ABIQ19_09430 [Sphingomonas sp.]
MARKRRRCATTAHRGDPWWMRVVLVIVGGLTAVVVAHVAPINLETIGGVAVALGAGKVGAVVVHALLSMIKR